MNGYRRWILTFNLLFIAAQLVVLVTAYSHLPPQVPLFYSRPWGEEQLVSPPFLFLLPLVSFLVFLFNALFSRILMAFPFLGKILSFTALLFAGLAFLDLLKVITIII